MIPGAKADGTATGTYRLVNRYSGLVLGLSGASGRLAETTPVRNWTDSSGSSVGDERTAAEQTLSLTPTGPAPETVSLVNPGAQSVTVGTAVSLRIDGADSAGKALTYRAKDLPPGLSISETGIVTGTPTTEGTTTVKVTATSGSATASTSFDWTVEPVLTGPHTLTTSGRALDVPDHSTDFGTQLVTWTPNGGANQTWEFSRQPDGSYEITNSESHLCMDVNGGSTSAGAAIIQWTCTGGTNQRWTVTAVPAGYTLTSLKSGLLLTTASTADGTPVTQEADSGSVLQHWSLG
ncbi:RICIN domain-containing protein [Streptomyces sp. NPDC002619]|uniref:RICIN domain-containing protein n=1 Tax=Streptomyces sp. NPDC002619 TaxID=3364655 RepID=UPI0036831632